MRGKGFIEKLHFAGTGITPAYAGKRHKALLSTGHCGDHPRICGEKKLIVFFDSFITGSPPHMRGKAHFVSALRRFCRITPAYAGKSLQSLGFHLQCGDHPRICGEKKLIVFFDSFITGSPPHMRGKAHFVSALRRFCRITPAYAGKSLNGVGKMLRRGDHPRICGEKRRSISVCW